MTCRVGETTGNLAAPLVGIAESCPGDQVELKGAVNIARTLADVTLYPPDFMVPERVIEFAAVMLCHRQIGRRGPVTPRPRERVR